MTIRILGALFILLGCGGVGFLLAAAYKKDIATLKSFIESMDMMESELKFRMTSLPLLCHYIAANQTGIMKAYFQNLEKELIQQIQPDAATCAVLALEQTPQMPKCVREMLCQLSRSLGEFDIEGQLLGIQSVKHDAALKLNNMCKDQEQRIKNYRTFGICAGTAIVILFI